MLCFHFLGGSGFRKVQEAGRSNFLQCSLKLDLMVPRRYQKAEKLRIKSAATISMRAWGRRGQLWFILRFFSGFLGFAWPRRSVHSTWSTLARLPYDLWACQIVLAFHLNISCAMAILANYRQVIGTFKGPLQRNRGLIRRCLMDCSRDFLVFFGW